MTIEGLFDTYLEKAVIGASFLYEEIAERIRSLPDDFFHDFYGNLIHRAIKSSVEIAIPLVHDQACLLAPDVDRGLLASWLLGSQTNAMDKSNTEIGIGKLQAHYERRQWYSYGQMIRDKTLAGESVYGLPSPVSTFIGRTFIPTELNLDQEVEDASELVPGIYAGMATTLQSPPGVGKSWLALYWSVKIMELGHRVAYFDEEMGGSTVHNRLLALGTDIDMVRERFLYFPFESRTWDEEDCRALAEFSSTEGLALVVFDSFSDFLVQAGFDESSNTDVNIFHDRVIQPFRRRGVATLLLDHLTKESDSADNKSRYARGAGAKLQRDDAALRIRPERLFDRNTAGLLHLSKTKDRPGMLTVPLIGDGSLPIHIQPREGSLTFMFGEKTGFEQEVIKAKRRITAHMRQAGTEERVRESTFRALLPGTTERDVIREALQQLKTEGIVNSRTNNGRFVWVKGPQLRMEEYNQSLEPPQLDSA